MSIQLKIPDDIARAIRLPEDRIVPALLAELAATLYAQGLLSFGKAKELSGLDRHDFARLLTKRKIIRHYTEADLEEDIQYAVGHQ